MGPYEETVHNYILANNISERAKHLDEITIFDVGYGLGIGLLCTLDFLSKLESPPFLRYISVEIDPELVKFSYKTIFKNSPYSQSLKDLKKRFIAKGKSFEIEILIGDARKSIKKLQTRENFNKFDVIYQDAFSPQRNPRLWSVEWFKDLKNLSKKSTTLSTYSSATPFRKSLLEAGWLFENIDGFSTKKTMTKAFLKGEMDQALHTKTTSSPLCSMQDK